MSKSPLNLAEPARAWVDAQVAAGATPDVDAYLAALIDRDRDRAQTSAACTQRSMKALPAVAAG